MENVDVNFGLSDSVYGVVSHAVLPNKAAEEVTKGATKLWAKVIFVSATKIGEKQHFKLLFFTMNLHFVTLIQMPTYRKTNLLFISGIYLVFLPLKMQGKLKQTKVYNTFFTLSGEKRPTNL